MLTDFFDGIARWELPQYGTLAPLFFQDLGCITAVYTAATDAVRALLPRTEMRPIELLPGRCLMVFTALEYRQCDLDPYNELAMAVPIAFGQHVLPVADALKQALQMTMSAYIWQLPVTTERARVAGVDIAGYPKFVADIDFEELPGRRACTLARDGRRILRLSCETGAARDQRDVRLRSYTLRDGIPLVSNLLVRQLRCEEHLHGRAATLELGDDPLADTLRGLRLSDNPVASQYSPQAQAILFFPRNLADA
ncbi:acetoacetate decarboxylase family protein [Caldimonas brevitalea]|uniref:Acetoacetate decarboxylase n=1 Tax=Caldimonas brevitalea TaxID=413882 RepID=A0A0G3BRL0_9BURK|nr:acetoacetate decarboxylase family protein [Caldimonas brevitalea]AKJ29180.1 hypothetical protein AAW51_2489 [Caldimonas brevitalea]